MIKKYEAVGISKLKPHLFEYVTKAEEGKVIYIIKHSKIVAKIEHVDFGGEINKESFLEGGVVV